MELEASAREKRNQKREKEKLLDRNKALQRQSAERLKEMENIKNKRLQALKSSGHEKIFDAYAWVQEHRHEFRKEVYGPVLIEVLFPFHNTILSFLCLLYHHTLNKLSFFFSILLFKLSYYNIIL